MYSHIVLQHNVPDLQRSFVKEFVRILAPDGGAAFQVTSEWMVRPAPISRRMLMRLPRPLRVAAKRLL